MEKNDIIDLLEEIEIYYPGKLKLDNPVKTVNFWHNALCECETEKVRANLVQHVRNSRFIPSIAELGDGAMKKKQPKRFVMDFNAGEDWEA